jgi:hypothetical protein
LLLESHGINSFFFAVEKVLDYLAWDTIKITSSMELSPSWEAASRSDIQEVPKML